MIVWSTLTFYGRSYLESYVYSESHCCPDPHPCYLYEPGARGFRSGPGAKYH